VTAEVLSYPALKYERMLRDARGGDVMDVITLLKFALENDISRTQVLKLAQELPAKQKHSPGAEEEIERFVRWCDSKEFVPAGKTEETHSSTPKAEAPRNFFDSDGREAFDHKKREELFEKAEQLGEEVVEAHSELNTHKYWYFRPGHEVDIALWNKAFGDNDPIPIIVWYLKSFFKSVTKSTLSRQTIELTSDDISIFRFTFDHAARVGRRTTNSSGSLITAAGLENIVDGGVIWDTETFAIELASSPNWLRELLIKYWAGRADFSVIEADDNSRKIVKGQVAAVSAALMLYCGRKTPDKLKGKFDVDFLNDETICNCLYKMDYVYVASEMDNELQAYISAAMSALYEARETVFGGVFPFSFGKAHELLC
jgi:hypothetical protein